MKRFYSILITLLAALSSRGQAVLNEIYVYPSPTNHEFFELYNTSTSQIPVSVDGYQLVSYFYEDNKTSGFYVMDLPNLSMQSKGFLVGSSAIPFNYQGNIGATASDFSWNDQPFMTANYGYVKKWVKKISLAPDGNPFYDEVAVSANLNDFFSRKGGSGASYNAFLYKDGLLVNSFIGGAGGNSLIPDFITDMPPLVMQNVKADGDATYLLTFSNYTSTVAEYVIQDVGTDNGYMRRSDGMCGTWEKSSSQAFHTPQTTNGTIQMSVKGQLTIDTHISRGLYQGDSSFITYNIVSGPDYMFPVELYIYADNGSVEDVWDANDEFLEEHTETTASDGPFTTSFLPQDQQVILVAKTAPGCYDQVRLVLNPDIPKTALPLKLKMFTGKVLNGKAHLEWVATHNGSGRHFEVERSRNGREFSKAGQVTTTAREGEEYYTFQELLSGPAYYRLKMVNRDGSTSYSPVVFVKERTEETAKLFILQNPVEATLVFTYLSTKPGQSMINIYNAVGVKVFSTRKTAQKGSNTYSMALDQKLTSGTYILEVVNETDRSVERFIRR